MACQRFQKYQCLHHCLSFGEAESLTNVMRNLVDIEHKVTLKSACGTETQVKYIQTKRRRYIITAKYTAVM
jgi:3-deoxy-D-manno-octulosonic-acid transferase